MYPPQQRPPHQYMQMQQQRMEMSPRGFPSPRMMPPGSPQTGMRPGMAPGPPQPRIQFHGHDPSTRCTYHVPHENIPTKLILYSTFQCRQIYACWDVFFTSLTIRMIRISRVMSIIGKR